MSISLVPRAALRASTPNPMYFGNDPNESGNKNWTHKNWLRSIFHFSFAEVHYPEPNRNMFGVLRVMNDDLVQPARGFGTHPHRDMEIATYIVDGSLTHKDNHGGGDTLGRGGVQFMSAGTGVMHSEFNNSPTDPLRFIQMWIVPRTRGMKPRYGSAAVAEEQRWKKWMHLVSDDNNTNASTPVKLNQDVNMYAAEFPEGDSMELNIARGRQAYILCVEGGEVTIDSNDSKQSKLTVAAHDAMEVGPNTQIKFTAAKGNAHMLAVEMSA